MFWGIPTDFSERRLNLYFGFGIKAQEYDLFNSELPHSLPQLPFTESTYMLLLLLETVLTDVYNLLIILPHQENVLGK